MIGNVGLLPRFDDDMKRYMAYYHAYSNDYVDEVDVLAGYQE